MTKDIIVVISVVDFCVFTVYRVNSLHETRLVDLSVSCLSFRLMSYLIMGGRWGLVFFLFFFSRI